MNMMVYTALAHDMLHGKNSIQRDKITSHLRKYLVQLSKITSHIDLVIHKLLHFVKCSFMV